MAAGTPVPIPDYLRGRIERARNITVLTGAGVSAASGVPTFRGDDGLWRDFRPEQLATADAFRGNPALVWEWYSWRRETIARCAPNAAHRVLAECSQRDSSSGEPWCRVITQNVDDLHVRAGTRGLVRLHGSIWEMSCWRRCGQPAWRDETLPDTPGRDDRPVEPPYRCPRCSGLARPAVVWFGEALNPADIRAATAACDCDVFLTVGTSAVVFPAAGLVDEARRRGALTVEINPGATLASSVVDVSLRGAAEEMLPRLLRQ